MGYTILRPGVGLGNDMGPEPGTWNVHWDGKAHGEMVQLQLLRFSYIWRHNKVPGQCSNKPQSQEVTSLSGQHLCGEGDITDWPQFDSYLWDLTCLHFTDEESDSRRLWNWLTVPWDRNRIQTLVCLSWRPVLIHNFVLSAQGVLWGIQDTEMLRWAAGIIEKFR